MTHIAKCTRISKAIAVFTLATITPLLAAQPETSEEELNEVKREFIEIKHQLEAIKDEAMEAKSVQQAYADEESVLKEVLLDESPQKSEMIEAYFEARSDYAAAYVNKDEEALSKLQGRIKEISTDIRTDLKKAQESEKMANATQATRDAILSAMIKIDPSTRELIKQQNELYQRFQELTHKG